MGAGAGLAAEGADAADSAPDQESDGDEAEVRDGTSTGEAIANGHDAALPPLPVGEPPRGSGSISWTGLAVEPATPPPAAVAPPAVEAALPDDDAKVAPTTITAEDDDEVTGELPIPPGLESVAEATESPAAAPAEPDAAAPPPSADLAPAAPSTTAVDPSRSRVVWSSSPSSSWGSDRRRDD